MVVGAGHVLAPAVFVGDVVGHHVAGVVVADAGIPVAVGLRSAHGDHAFARAPVRHVDAAARGAADHGTDRGADRLAAAVADAAAQHRAGDGAEHAGDEAAGVIAAAGIGVVSPTVTVAVAAVRVVAMDVSAAAHLAVAPRPGRACVLVEHRIHAQHARPFVLRLRTGAAPVAAS